jgi:uncharacterized protein (DUF58 family)
MATRLPMLVPASTPRPRTIEDLAGPGLLARLDRLDLLSRKVFAGKLPGERRSKKRGQSVEFDDYRDYVPGDDLRHVDWNVFARLDRFFVKLFREEEDLGLHLVIDASRSMDAGTPSKLVFTQRLAMALGYIGLVNQNRVAVSVMGGRGGRGLRQIAPMRGRRNVRRLADFILSVDEIPGSELQTGEPPSTPLPSLGFNAALRAVALSRRGRGVMVVLSDFLVREEVRIGLNYLAGGGHDTYLIQVLSPGELEPEKEPGGAVVGDLRLTDAETGDAAEVTLSAPLLRKYKQRLEGYVASLRVAASARGMSHALLRSDADLAPLLLDYLRTRGLLG